MIKSLTIKNFQSWKDATFEFTEGLNVIAGPSHKGKSAIVRALRWAIENEPRGESFKSYFADSKDDVSVSILFSEGIRLTRERGRENSYLIEYPNGKIKVLKALNTGVPDEIRELTQMTSLNLRSQIDSYYMLQDRPGNRAKTLNKLVGLDIIDESNKKANSALSIQLSKIKGSVEDLESVETKLSSFTDLDEMEKSVKKIDALFGQQTKLKEKRTKLKSNIQDIKFIRSEKKELTSWLKVESKVSTIENFIEQTNKIKKSRSTLLSIINDAKASSKTVTESNNFLKVLTLLEKITS